MFLLFDLSALGLYFTGLKSEIEFIVFSSKSTILLFILRVEDLKNNSDSIKSKLRSGIIVLTCVLDNKVSVVTSITNDLIEKYDSNTIVKRIVNFLDGKGGGGRKDLAQGGAPLGKKFYELKDSLKEIISKSIV